MADRDKLDARLLLLTLTAGCAVLGGLLGGLLARRFWVFPAWQLLLLLIAGAVVAFGAALLLTTDGSRAPGLYDDRGTPVDRRPVWHHPAQALPPGTPHTLQPTTPGPSSPQPEPPPRAALPAVSPPTEAKVVLSLREGVPTETRGERSWWTEGRRSRSGGGHAAPVAAGAPPLSSYDPESALVAQCPNCGGFRLDVSQTEAGYVFRCRTERCGATWEWAPGTPWPAVTVRRNPRGGSSDARRD